MLHNTPTSSTPRIELSPKEKTLLRAYAFGLSDREIVEIINFQRIELQSITQALFKKFRVKNLFILVSKAIDMGFIDYQGSINESTKTAILSFIDQNVQVFSLGERMPEAVRVKWYKVLLIFLEEEKKVTKKNPTEAGKTFRSTA